MMMVIVKFSHSLVSIWDEWLFLRCHCSNCYFLFPDGARWGGRIV